MTTTITMRFEKADGTDSEHEYTAEHDLPTAVDVKHAVDLLPRGAIITGIEIDYEK